MAAGFDGEDQVRIKKVLVANRGEIAVRVIRAATDAGLPSVAIYADPDSDSLFVQLAGEAYALGGATPAETYLDQAKILDVAARSGANAIHPGYGFLAENAAFAQAVIDAGLIWIGPPPAAIEALGDKVQARHIAQRVGAPLVPGTSDPVADADAVLAFAEEFGLPVAIKAAYGGGGRGLKVARELEEIPELFESATREAVTAFGRGECFVERYLDRPRHVETQCLADAHGGVVVVSTRDCSLQRRHQKLVEEAPAPFLSADQRDRLYASSKAILLEAGYVGAGTCEFLVGQDGTISFLEVNTRLQVEHPVSEAVTGLDLVREMFRIAEGEPLGYEDPVTVGHSIEFRINAEDAGRNFMPAPGTLTAWRAPSGPGVRVDEGYLAGMTVPGSFDSLVAKIIVTGADRSPGAGPVPAGPGRAGGRGDADRHALPSRRARRSGVHRRGRHLRGAHPLDRDRVQRGDRAVRRPGGGGSRAERAVHRGRRGQRQAARGGPARRVRRRQRRGGSGPGQEARAARRGGDAKAPSGNALTSPMQGTIVKVAVADGDTVAAGDLVVVLEAMKMEQPLTAHRAGIVTKLSAEVGATVTSGSTLCEIVDEPA